MSRDRQSDQRRTYLVKKDFQVAFILKFCLILLAGVILSTVLLFFFSQDTLTSSYQHSRLVIRNTGSAILPAMIYTNLITLVVVIFAAIGVTLFISHKIAGPMYRFEKELAKIGQGDLRTKVVLRQHDQAVDMAHCINSMTESLHHRIEELRIELEALNRIAIDHQAPDAVVQKIGALQQGLEHTFKL